MTLKLLLVETKINTNSNTSIQRIATIFNTFKF